LTSFLIGVTRNITFDHNTCTFVEGPPEAVTWGNLEQKHPAFDKNSLASRIDWAYYGVQPPVPSTPLQSQSTTPQQEQLERWNTHYTIYMYEVLGIPLVFTWSDYDFDRSRSTNNVEGVVTRRHWADIFTTNPFHNWTLLNRDWGKSCDWGGPCLPGPVYWEHSYGWFQGNFPGGPYNQRIWAVANSYGSGRACGTQTQYSLNGNLGQFIPFGVLTPIHLCPKLVIPLE